MKISDKYEVKADELNVIVREKFIPQKGKNKPKYLIIFQLK